MLSDRLAEELVKCFPDKAVQLHAGRRPAASVASAHPSWEPIEIWDDEDELTVFCGQFTHVHFGNYDEDLSVEQREAQIVSDAISFLEDVFADRIEFYTMVFGGGCRPRGSQGKWFWIVQRGPIFVWSGPTV
jgi:hypothetical protein